MSSMISVTRYNGMRASADAHFFVTSDTNFTKITDNLIHLAHEKSLASEQLGEHADIIMH